MHLKKYKKYKIIIHKLQYFNIFYMANKMVYNYTDFYGIAYILLEINIISF